MSEATEQITLDELIQLALDARLAEVHTSMPAVVTAYNRTAVPPSVNVTIPVRGMIPDGSGNFVSDPYPALQNIPIAWPAFGKFAITFPIEVGDTGTLDCCERNIGGWMVNGQPQDCADVGMHTLDGAVFRPGLSPQGPGHASATNMVLGSETDAKGRIVCKPAGGQLGEGSSDGIARSGDSVSLGACYVTVGAGAVTAVFINGVALPVAADPTPPNRGTVSGGSTTWTCED